MTQVKQGRITFLASYDDQDRTLPCFFCGLLVHETVQVDGWAYSDDRPLGPICDECSRHYEPAAVTEEVIAHLERLIDLMTQVNADPEWAELIFGQRPEAEP